MDLSFGWLLAQRSLSLRQLCRPTVETFSFVQPSELEDASEFIQPDSLVLTVGIAFQDRPEQLPRYIEHLIDAGAVAIGFGTGVGFPTVPEQVLTTARRRGVGVFEVPRHVPFISIVTTAGQEQRRREQLEYQRLVDAQARLTTTAVTGSLRGLLTAGAELLAARLVLRNADGEMIDSAVSPELTRAETAGERTFYSAYRMASRADRHHSLEVSSAKALNTQDQALVRHCTGLADMLLARPADLRSARNDINSLALALRLDLSDGPLQLPADRDWPVDAEGMTRPVVVAADNARLLARARHAFDAASEQQGRFLYALNVSSTCFIALCRPGQSAETLLDMFGPTATKVRIAIGRLVPVDEIDADYVSSLATRAFHLGVGEHLGPTDTDMSWLAEPAVRSAFRARAAEIFGPLREHDATHGTEYARTLTVYLRHGGQLSATAEALGVHRHTTRNRIAQIQRICELDLGDPAVFAEAFFAAATPAS
ncbi:PucR family transcriptional regulator [Corynebacterium frankenforstense]|uniref:PucR family transcriptional regulator n=1 Tax=Corynebacterium TaxID=1716 RepID=UPI00254A18A7|nr:MULTISPECIES: PucR family transcriptional regulator [Corynebacterium]MDK6259617.1 PucR family transcriptional regulator [Corynebacterium frankenforstense]MDK8894815.1 PucR family transcriptional regulator [Corynebacterium sp. MSK006]